MYNESAAFGLSLVTDRRIFRDRVESEGEVWRETFSLNKNSKFWPRKFSLGRRVYGNPDAENAEGALYVYV